MSEDDWQYYYGTGLNTSAVYFQENATNLHNLWMCECFQLLGQFEWCGEKKHKNMMHFVNKEEKITSTVSEKQIQQDLSFLNSSATFSISDYTNLK